MLPLAFTIVRFSALVFLLSMPWMTSVAQWSLGAHGAGQYTLSTVEGIDPTGLAEVDVRDGVGYVAGLQLRYILSENWSLGLGVLYERRSHTIEASADTSFDVLGLAVRGELFTSTRITRSYLQVPLMARWRPVPWLGLEAGVAGTFLLASDAVTTGELDVALFGFGTEVPITTSSTSTDGLRPALLQACAGLAFLVHPRVDISLSYMRDLGPLEDDDIAGNTEQQAFRLGVTYAFLRSGTER